MEFIVLRNLELLIRLSWVDPRTPSNKINWLLDNFDPFFIPSSRIVGLILQFFSKIYPHYSSVRTTRQFLSIL